MKKIIMITTAVLMVAGALCSQSLDEMNALLVEIDHLGNFEDDDFSCVYTIVSEKPGEERSVTEALMFRRDQNDQFVLLIRKPEVQKGEGYFQSGDNVWFYDPQSRKFEHSSLSENIADSDTKNSDLARGSLAEDYTVESWEDEEIGGRPVYVLSLKAKHDDVSYDRMKVWVRKDVTIVLKSEDYGFSGNLMRTTGYFKYVKLGEGKLLPTQILMIDAINVGEKTQVTLKSPSLRAIPDHVFSKSYLELVNK